MLSLFSKPQITTIYDILRSEMIKTMAYNMKIKCVCGTCGHTLLVSSTIHLSQLNISYNFYKNKSVSHILTCLKGLTILHHPGLGAKCSVKLE